MYTETTEDIEVAVHPDYVADQSRPDEEYYFFAYKVTIRNRSARWVKLLSRHWVVTDGHGEVEHVRGPGVVGQQPELAPGQAYEYTSFCPLATPTGNMHGTYKMTDSDGIEFDVIIPLFFFQAQEALH